MKLVVTVEGKRYEVEVEASEVEPVAPAPPVVPAARVPAVAPPPRPQAGGEAVADEAKVCRSPIAGTVIRVLARPGLAVQPGDVLLVLEAMKMETNITAPVAATVATLKAQQGEAVKSGQVVVVFE